ncbi:hypothetical protein FB446DRAFT_709724 [Lentinula raphanica]|nr:hypothetical protein FB446DRAFT_709724 [Lentinula raphanica]
MGGMWKDEDLQAGIEAFDNLSSSHRDGTRRKKGGVIHCPGSERELSTTTFIRGKFLVQSLDAKRPLWELSELWRRTLDRETSSADRAGWIYVFHEAGLAGGIFKVGRTNDLERRLHEWKVQCPCQSRTWLGAFWTPFANRTGIEKQFPPSMSGTHHTQNLLSIWSWRPNVPPGRDIYVTSPIDSSRWRYTSGKICLHWYFSNGLRGFDSTDNRQSNSVGTILLSDDDAEVARRGGVSLTPLRLDTDALASGYRRPCVWIQTQARYFNTIQSPSFCWYFVLRD